MSYEEMFQMFRDGKISREVWQEYCFNRLVELMQENIDVFIRLKDR